MIDTKTKTVVQGPIAVGLAPRGIAITPNGGRAYVTNSGDDTVTVLNTGTYATVGDPIAVGDEPDGVAVTPDGGTVFVAQRGGGIAVINANTAEVVDTIDDSLGPSRITIGPRGGRGLRHQPRLGLGFRVQPGRSGPSSAPRSRSGPNRRGSPRPRAGPSSTRRAPPTAR